MIQVLSIITQNHYSPNTNSSWYRMWVLSMMPIPKKCTLKKVSS